MDPLPEKKPKMSSTSLLTGTNFATGSPCLVITTVSCLAFTSSMMARQFALNFPAATVFIMKIIPWSLYHGYILGTGRRIKAVDPENLARACAELLFLGMTIRCRIDVRDYDLLPYVSVWNRIGD